MERGKGKKFERIPDCIFFFQFKFCSITFEIEFRYIYTGRACINYNSIIVIDSQQWDSDDGISRSKIHPFRIDLNLYRLSKIGWWGRGRRGGKKSAFPPAEIRFFNFYKIRLSHSNNTHLPMQFPGENRLSTAAKLDRQICCFTRFTHAPPYRPIVCARHVK